VEPRRVLICVAHPDDESLGMGGTIAKLTERGHAVFVMALVDGERARLSPCPSKSDLDAMDNRVRRRAEQFRQALRVLGATAVPCVRWDDQRLDTAPLLKVTQVIEQAIMAHQIDTVYTHTASDLNADHVVVYRAALTAARRVPRVYCFATPSSVLRRPFWPHLFEDIDSHLDTKCKAVACYHDESCSPQRTRDALVRAAGRWFDETGLTSVEAFEVVRDVA